MIPCLQCTDCIRKLKVSVYLNNLNTIDISQKESLKFAYRVTENARNNQIYRQFLHIQYLKQTSLVRIREIIIKKRYRSFLSFLM